MDKPKMIIYDDDKPGKPITWFKTATAGFMVEKLRPLIEMLNWSVLCPSPTWAVLCMRWKTWLCCQKPVTSDMDKRC